MNNSNSILLMTQLIKILKRLRDPKNGCPWHLQQNYNTLIAYSEAELYELFEAVIKKDTENLCEELGDLLFHILYYSQIASEEGNFSFEDVLQGIYDKLVRRHPHIFTKNFPKTLTIDEISCLWQKIKQEEKTKTIANTNKNKLSVFEDVNSSLPPLLEALGLQKKANNEGFAWQKIEQIFDKIHEEEQELLEALRQQNNSALELEYGDLLFTVLNLANHLNINPETALKRTNLKFRKRFHFIEEHLFNEKQHFKQKSKPELNTLWEKAKRATKESD